MTEQDRFCVNRQVKRARRIAISIIAFFCVLFILFLPIIVGASGGVYAAAEADDQESSGIMRELSGLTINGKKFNAANYPALGFGNVNVLFMNEVGYNYYANKQDNYQLTLYVYNPAQYSISDDARNTVQMRMGGTGRYNKYDIKLLDASSDKLFYKFSVDFKADEKSAALSKLDKEKRIYTISSIEIFISGYNAKDFSVARTYTYTGYGAGMDGDGSSEVTLASTLSYTVAGGTTVVPIDVHHTSWRPEGTNGSGDNVQDTIHSVYFAVPKELDEQYDYLKSIKAQWIEATTKEIFVTENEDLWKAMYELIKDNVLSAEQIAPEKFDFTNFEWALGCYNWDVSYFQIGYNMNGNRIVNNIAPNKAIVNKEIEAIFMSYYTGGVAAEDFVVTSSEVAELIRSNDFFYNDKKVAGKYPSYLFRQWDDEFHTEVITRGEKDKELNLHSEEVKRNWWQKIFGGSTVENVKDYENIEAIQEVTDSLALNGGKKTVCEKLYISERDYDDFIKFYNSQKATSTVYLLRFATSKYISDKTLIYKQNNAGYYIKQKDETGYLASATCYLDFDIIDFEYVKDDVSHVIPVSMSPIDIFSELTPPVDVKTNSSFWIYGLAIIAGLIVVLIIWKEIKKLIERKKQLKDISKKKGEK